MFFEIYGFERVGGLWAAVIVEGSVDRGGGAEWKATRIGSFCTRTVVRVPVGRAGPLLRLWGGEKLVISTPRGGGAYDRPTTGILLLRRAQKARGGEFAHGLNLPENRK